MNVQSLYENDIIETEGVNGVKALTFDETGGIVESEITGGGGEGWTPHPDWIDISTVGDNEINLLVNDVNVGIAFSVVVASSGTYSIDWGDGTVETLRASGTTYTHNYTVGAGTSVDDGLYTVFKIRIYGASGDITRFQVQRMTGYTATSFIAPILWAVFGTTAITDYSFTFYQASLIGCHNMESCTIPSFASCTTAEGMFQNCRGLREVNLPSSWGALQSTKTMFSSCVSLKLDSIPSDWGNITDVSSMFAANNQLQTISLPTSWGSITKTVSMFSACNQLKEITLPTSWGSVDDVSSMFASCQTIKTLTLPASWGSITNLFNFINSGVSLLYINLPSSWGSVTNVQGMFASCTSLPKITLPSSFGNVTNAQSMLNGCVSLKTVTNLQYLGSSSNACDMGTVLTFAEALTGTLTIGSLVFRIGISGNSSTKLKCTGIRLTNASSTFEGVSPQVDVSYTDLSATALNQLFYDLPTLTGKTIRITGATGAGTCNTSIATGKGWTVTN